MRILLPPNFLIELTHLIDMMYCFFLLRCKQPCLTLDEYNEPWECISVLSIYSKRDFPGFKH